jgi:hypothetical protein
MKHGEKINDNTLLSFVSKVTSQVLAFSCPKIHHQFSLIQSLDAKSRFEAKRYQAKWILLEGKNTF